MMTNKGGIRPMKWEQIRKVIAELAQSQGLYSRMLSRIENLEKLGETGQDALSQWIDELEKQNFKNPVDFILFIES